MNTNVTFHDRLSRLAQEGTARGVLLVRITGLDANNRYKAVAIEFQHDGTMVAADATEIRVTNLAEPADMPGQLSAGTEAVAVDVEGRWIVFVRQASSVFPAKITSGGAGGAYTAREQVSGGGTLADRQDTADIDVTNLAEMTLGPGGAVDAGTIVLVAALQDAGNPPTLRYVFDHPVYAKYLD
jgi:hypothetical protein